MILTNKIGVLVDSFRAGLHEGLAKAKKVGADGVQFYAGMGEMDPDRLTPRSRREVKDVMASLGLELSAICGDLGGHGFQDASLNKQKIEKSKRILDLALDLGTNIVTTHIGLIPEQQSDPIYEAMWRACEEISNYATRSKAFFAVETGPEKCVRLKAFLDSLTTSGVSVNFDPANLVMVAGDDPVAGVKLLKDYIVHTHVKDGIQLQAVDPRIIYGLPGYEGIDHAKIAALVTSGEAFRETPLGEGQVRFDAYFAALREIGYTGYLTVEREGGDKPEADIRQAVQFIERYKRQ
ncbi:sugar phosphate isomerase/epimerase [Cohnella ginsengisoli]|uniref:Sugar phosphate isomerase/epimerase n=1 Tax=Cohnella ginsengisoli TaxID=425004 RepID=A0A9X4QMJ5_9BACL|nr:sugar phosphate isomerase/epimerase family protein [Cohnella ginsengisoli]MDG0791302.1 sugar phosphate isomerase/epimerase [Cohnella ginsengisoli]